MRSFLAAALLCLLSVMPVHAQFPTQTVPQNSGTGGTVTSNGGTITVTSAYQLVLAASASRKDCLIQNQGTHNMNVANNSAGTNSLILTPNQTFKCSGGVTIGDPIYLTGTATDAFVVWNQ